MFLFHSFEINWAFKKNEKILIYSFPFDTLLGFNNFNAPETIL
jgi:hypothetical protein